MLRKKMTVEGLLGWLLDYATCSGGRVPLLTTLDDIEVHSRYGKTLRKLKMKRGVIRSAKENRQG
jgi:hypothetical protein